MNLFIFDLDLDEAYTRVFSACSAMPTRIMATYFPFHPAALARSSKSPRQLCVFFPVLILMERQEASFIPQTIFPLELGT